MRTRFICPMLLLVGLPLQNCASVQEFVKIQDVFKGNTQRDPQNYSLEDKSEYRKHNYLLKLKQKEDEKEILKRLEKEKKKK